MHFAARRRMSLARWSRSLLSSLAFSSLAACQHQAPVARTHGIVVQAETAGRTPLAGVEVARGSSTLGKTLASGSLSLELDGSEGERIELEARCPTGYVPERQAFGVTLRQLRSAHKLPTYRVDCQPATRTTVIAVRATNGPDLPVMYLGREVARTDSSGVAHLALTLKPGERYELGLDTTGKPLLPKSPRAVFVVGNQDELVIFDQRFQKRKTSAGRSRSRLPTAF
jgi:hypothetical protein